MARLRINFVEGLLSEDLTATATEFESDALATVPTITGEDYLPIVLDPAARFGKQEIAYIKSHTFGQKTALIVRAKEGTTARAHQMGVPWTHGPLAADFTPAAETANDDVSTLYWMEVH